MMWFRAEWQLWRASGVTTNPHRRHRNWAGKGVSGSAGRTAGILSLALREGLSQLIGLSVSAESGHLVPSCDHTHAPLVFL